MPRACFIKFDGNLLLFGFCMNRIGCASINNYTILKQTIFLGSFKRLCYRGEKMYHIYENDFLNGYNKYDVTSHVFPNRRVAEIQIFEKNLPHRHKG